MELPNKQSREVPTAATEPPKSKNLQPVITGAVQAKRPATRRFMDFVFAESPKAIGAKIGRDVIVPRIKAGVEEAFKEFLAGMLWGNGPRPMSQMVSGTVLRGGGVNYNAISQQPSPQLLAAQANQSRSSGNYQDVICPTQQQAEHLLANLIQVHNQWNVVAVGDLYEMANIETKPSDSAYGWTSLDGARITKTRDGYALELPRPHLI